MCQSMKRICDIVAAVALLVFLSPVILVVAATVQLVLGSPVIFGQERPGRGTQVFRLYKFRTMTSVRDANGQLLPDTQRMTGLGRFLRSTSLDELPGLWNVLVGDMSLVGPRPLVREYLDRYTDAQMRRHDVRPGITGLAQVSGRNDLPWEQRLELDTWYVDNQSLWLDLRILAQTFVKVFRREGASRPGQSDMPDFRSAQLLGDIAPVGCDAESPAGLGKGSGK